MGRSGGEAEEAGQAQDWRPVDAGCGTWVNPVTEQDSGKQGKDMVILVCRRHSFGSSLETRLTVGVGVMVAVGC